MHCRVLFLGFWLIAMASTTEAEPVTFEALISTEADQNLVFPKHSQRIVRLVQRRGPTTGEGPLAGSHLLEWGLHDIGPERGTGQGFLVFSHTEQDQAFLEFSWQAIPIGTQPRLRYLLKGNWRVVAGSGKHRRLIGLGVLSVDIVTATQRRWVFEGDFNQS